MSFGPWGGAAIGAGGGIIGSAITMNAMKKEARRQREWTEKMRSTAYQATMSDMAKAGLNPILAYKSGPTPHGSGAMARFPDMGQAITGGMRAGSETSAKSQTVQVLKAQEDLINAQATNAKFQFNKNEALSDFYGGALGKGTAAAGEITGALGNLLRGLFGKFGVKQKPFPKSVPGRPMPKKRTPLRPGPPKSPKRWNIFPDNF